MRTYVFLHQITLIYDPYENMLIQKNTMHEVNFILQRICG